MILPETAPAQFAEVIRWLQAHFDELDYVELLCTLEELSAGIDNECARENTQGMTVPGRTS